MAKHIIDYTVADKNKCALIKDLLGKTGKYAYDKYSLKSNETITETLRYDDYLINVRLVIPCDIEDKVWTEAILYKIIDKESEELDVQMFTEPREEFFSEWVFEVDGNESIILNLKERK